MSPITRRQFLTLAGATAGSILFGAGCAGQATETASRRQPVEAPTGDQAYLAVARGTDPAEITRRALAALGVLNGSSSPVTR